MLIYNNNTDIKIIQNLNFNLNLKTKWHKAILSLNIQIDCE